MIAHRLFAASLLLAASCGIAEAQWIQFPPPQVGAPAVTTAVAHQFVTAFPTPGSPLTQAQPAFSDLSGSLTSAQCPNGTTLVTGCLQVGGGLAVAAGVVRVATLAGVSHQWVSSINSSGVPQLTQPNTTDLATAATALLLGNGSTVGSYAGSTCTNQAVTAISAVGAATCTSLTNAFLSAGTFSNITGTGTLAAGATGAGFTVALGTSTITGVLAGVNGGTGVANTGKTITVGGNLSTGGVFTTGGTFSTVGNVSMTGAGATTLAFTGSTATFTFPTTSGGDTLAGLGFGNKFTVGQTISLNTASLPSLGANVLTLAAADAASTRLFLLSAATSSNLRFLRGDGTVASPTALVANDVIGSMSWLGWNGSAYAQSALIQGYSTESWSVSANGAAVEIFSSLNGATTVQGEAIFQNGVALLVSPSVASVAEGIGTINAPNGYWVTVTGTPTNVITSAAKGVFAGGLTATIASSTAALNYACYNNSTGVFTYDASSTCLVSSLRFKHDVRPVESAIGKVMAMDPIEFVYNDQSNVKGPQIGLSAESVARAEPILATYDDQNRPEKVKYIGMVGLLTAAIQEQQREIQALQQGR